MQEDSCPCSGEWVESEGGSEFSSGKMEGSQRWMDGGDGYTTCECILCHLDMLWQMVKWLKFLGLCISYLAQHGKTRCGKFWKISEGCNVKILWSGGKGGSLMDGWVWWERQLVPRNGSDWWWPGKDRALSWFIDDSKKFLQGASKSLLPTSIWGEGLRQQSDRLFTLL